LRDRHSHRRWRAFDLLGVVGPDWVFNSIR
jgi:hypothetical protein